ncbi:MAG: hypothetical protein HY288_08420 [Planctomycetia bacterium]|nr:hypothetical protein [Planctomycetia bacterium]
MNRDLLKKSAVFCALVSLAVTVRLVSETPNFSAVAAAALFAGFYFRHRTTAICVPLAIMTISDQVLGGYAKPMMVAVYGSLLIPIAWRSLLHRGLTPVRVGLGAVSSSLAFYVLTNAAVWLTWYPATWQGLLRCYAVALPFFANTLAGDLFFAAGFFGLYALATRASEATARVVAPQVG